jgi:hypothetical protein
LSVSRDVSCDPIAEFLGLNVCELLDHLLVVVEIIGELFSVIFNKVYGSDFDKTWSNISHN